MIMLIVKMFFKETGLTTIFFKGAQVGGANLGSFWFSFIFSHKQRLRPLGYCAPLSLTTIKRFKILFYALLYAIFCVSQTSLGQSASFSSMSAPHLWKSKKIVNNKKPSQHVSEKKKSWQSWKKHFFFLLTFPAAVMGQVVGIFASLSSLAILAKEG